MNIPIEKTYEMMRTMLDESTHILNIHMEANRPPKNALAKIALVNQIIDTINENKLDNLPRDLQIRLVSFAELLQDVKDRFNEC